MNENCLVGRPGGCGGLVKIAAPPVDILVSCNAIIVWTNVNISNDDEVVLRAKCRQRLDQSNQEQNVIC